MKRTWIMAFFIGTALLAASCGQDTAESGTMPSRIRQKVPLPGVRVPEARIQGTRMQEAKRTLKKKRPIPSQIPALSIT